MSQQENPYSLKDNFPFSLDVLKTLAGISNGERISAEAKKAADDTIIKILDVMRSSLNESVIEML